MISIASLPNPTQEEFKNPDEFPIGSQTTNAQTTTLDEDPSMGAWRQELEQNWSGGYAQMPNVVRNATLSPKAKIVYEQLLSYMWFKSDTCWPAQKTLAAATGYSCRTIIRALQELYDRGYIEVERRGLGLPNRYFLNPLSFARSFRPISGPRTASLLPHHNVLQVQAPKLRQSIATTTPRPVEPFYPEVTKWHNGSDNVAQPDVSESHTNYTKSNPSESELEKRDSRSGSAAELGVKGGSPTTIRNTKSSGTETRNGDQTETKSKSVPAEGKSDAVRAESAKPSKRKKHGKGEQPPALPIYVEESLKLISTQFCDQSRKSSATSVAWLCADMRQRGGDEYAFSMVMDLVKDITIAKTPTIQARNEDGTIAQMRYFLSVLESTVDSWCNAYDEALALQVNETPESVAPEPQEEQLAPTSIPETIADTEQSLPVEQKPRDPEPTSIVELAPSAETIAMPEPPSMSEQALPVEQIAELEMIIETGDPAPGWTYTTALWWAERLCGYLGHDQYECAIWPIRGTERYGFVIRDVRPGSTWEEYSTKQQASARWKQQAKK